MSRGPSPPRHHSRFERKAKRAALSLRGLSAVHISDPTRSVYPLKPITANVHTKSHHPKPIEMSSNNDKSEVAVDKVNDNDKAGDAKAEVKGTKRAAEEKGDEVKKAKREENGDDDEVEDDEEDVEGEEEEEEEDIPEGEEEEDDEGEGEGEGEGDEDEDDA